MSVELIKFDGSDELIARFARLSFAKYRDPQINIEKLIHGMRKKRNHFTPFTHASATVLITAPLFVARQLWRHTVGFGFTDFNSWSERSGRYTEPSGDYYVPKEHPEEIMSHFLKQDEWWLFAMDQAIHNYKKALIYGYPKEKARALLPQGMMTCWGWTANVAAWQRLFKLRLADDAQEETREIVAEIQALLVPHFPLSLGEMG